jgi:hypothetical protein
MIENIIYNCLYVTFLCCAGREFPYAATKTLQGVSSLVSTDFPNARRLSAVDAAGTSISKIIAETDTAAAGATKDMPNSDETQPNLSDAIEQLQQSPQREPTFAAARHPAKSSRAGVY